MLPAEVTPAIAVSPSFDTKYRSVKKYSVCTRMPIAHLDGHRGDVSRDRTAAEVFHGALNEGVFQMTGAGLNRALAPEKKRPVMRPAFSVSSDVNVRS